MAKHAITFVVDTERDRDILRWLGNQDNKSAAIREAIRLQLGRGGITLTDVYEAIQDLKRRNWAPASDSQPLNTADDCEPLDVASALNNLGL
jgi:hypothetical protein